MFFGAPSGSASLHRQTAELENRSSHASLAECVRGVASLFVHCSADLALHDAFQAAMGPGAPRVQLECSLIALLDRNMTLYSSDGDCAGIVKRDPRSGVEGCMIRIHNMPEKHNYE